MSSSKLSFSDARAKLRETLHERLGVIAPHSCCAHLNYPSHLNIGDHLIWLGEVDYLHNIRNVDIAYASDFLSLSISKMRKMIGCNPIFLHGGGNLGDLWTTLHSFTETVVDECIHNPIYIFPQTIHFQDQENLKRTASIFNSHPCLTIFTREWQSYRTAKEHFYNCQVVLCPDMAFHLQLEELAAYCPSHRKQLLLLSRTDKESASLSLEDVLDKWSREIEQQDWISITRGWCWGIHKIPISVFLTRLYREVIQRGLLTPREWSLRREWINSTKEWDWIRGSRWHSLHKISLNLLFDGYRQLSNRRFIITNRLHVHILSSLIGVPNILMPNSNHKNQSYYQTWSQDFRDSYFATTTQEIEMSLRDALENQSESGGSLF